MTNVVVVINSLVSAPLADGVTAGDFRFSIQSKAGGDPLNHDTGDTSATFTDVEPGDYTASVCRRGSDGNPIAAPITADFSVADSTPAPTPTPVPTVVMADVPATITVSLV